ncbi:MAG: T9SS type A sorting domain-containing protein [Bacteroidia bacterium]|nr:T9SS type A sorting domain-containing protein [Bacteroidia bacterium]
MKNIFLIFYFILLTCAINGQGYNHQWLVGNASLFSEPKSRLYFTDSSYSYQTEYRKMSFKDTQGNISDVNGNFMMSSNGVWIANSKNDTMLNGTGLNPGYFANSWPNGLVINDGNIILPFPDDSTKYILFHQTELDPNSSYGGIYCTTIDMTLDSGFGGVIQKNDTLIQDSLSWGIAACKHANGRDWWIVIMKDSSDKAYKILLTPNGVSSISTQSLNFLPHPWENAPQIEFSPDGTKFIYATYNNPNQKKSFSILVDFDRCSGLFSNTHKIHLVTGDYLWGNAFSPSSQFVYVCSTLNIFQINTSTYAVDTVATYDGFMSGLPPTCCATTFMNMYLAANGKIYLTSGSSSQHLHEINYPDSAGVLCDVQQHSISLGVWNLRSVPNHPNYHLGRLQGSPCDTLQWTNINELEFDFRFRIYPNPVTSNSLHIGYLLPQNKNGLFQIYDVTGKVVYKYNLPQWSNEQQLTLPKLANGVYSATIISSNKKASITIAIMNE